VTVRTRPAGARRKAYPAAKRVGDVVVSAGVLVLGSPLLAAVALLVRRDLGAPVLFRQDRPGKDGKVFTLVKFRTMRDVDLAAGLVEEADRLTATGRLLRATSLDELPTFWNVLRGDMSLVGPRPLRTHYLPLYTPHQARRHEVRPGITGLAQVNGRNDIDWGRRLDLDVEYVDRSSVGLDLRILARTVALVLRRSGVSSPVHATMPAFTGTEPGGDRAR
jgi:lipopolysaccharide/colanic/teichoic acid biosynthesis glycosyltransferase